MKAAVLALLGIPTIVACLAVVGPQPASAEPYTAIFQEFSVRACHAIAPRPRGERMPTQMRAWRCPSFRDYDVTYFGHQGDHAIRIDPPGKPAEAPQLRTRFGFGERIEWRGRGTGATFEPYAAIMRSRLAREGQLSVPVYEVLKVEADAVCRAAVVEAPPTPEGLEKARAVADEIAGGFRCGTSPPQLSGFE